MRGVPVNPFGTELVRHALEQTRDSNPSGTIGEWQPTRLLLLTEPNWALTVFWWLFWLNPFVLVAVLANKRREFPWSHGLVVAGMSVLAWRANQFTALYAIVTAPILAHGLAVIRARIAGRQHSDWGETTARVVAGVRRVPHSRGRNGRWAVAENRPPKFGVGVDESVVPMRALSMMAKLPVGLNVFKTLSLRRAAAVEGIPAMATVLRRPREPLRTRLYGSATQLRRLPPRLQSPPSNPRQIRLLTWR